MTPINIILKRTDDGASPGFEAIVLIIKVAMHPLPPTPPGKQETKIRIRRYQAAES
ncbi:hypothetical protein [Salisediminibacterium halotolerans]|uniref:hypothetical protein n=1 Tax=Salisediminibacterium halotolerans TaxID=517425 RepID=UPI00131537A2|nr:hypothetical protein [Salisediminibacterium halotolerans]